MEIGKTLYVKDRKEWRDWLVKNHANEKCIWLIYYRKSSGKQRIPYDDAVEEALCFGWIDSTVKGIDDEKFAQRYTPRRPDSILSQPNKERLRKMIAEKKMTENGLKAVSHVFKENEKFVIPKDIMDAIKKSPDAWKHFKKFPERYKRIRIAYVEEVRNYSNEMFKKRLENFIKVTAKNKRFGQILD